MPASPRKTVRLLESLNLFGLTHLDPVILAALVDERPLLLIAPHGTAKSELLNRLAACLGLEHRHYNASLIAFDDLLGFPVPNPDRTGLDYLPTPGNLWDAESVFLDEISRCRPENQNKLFSVIHEKRIQGLALPKLRYRWSAMNPPLTGEEDENEDVYEGSLPLDPALADRFTYIVTLPSLPELDSPVRRRIILHGGDAPTRWPDLGCLIDQARRQAEVDRGARHGWAARYVDALVGPLQEARFPISGRRAVALARSILSIAGAGEALGLDLGLEGAAFLALKWGLPQRGQGRRIDEAQLRAIHALALKVAGEGSSSLWSRIRGLTDPVRRVALALAHYPKEVSKLELSNLVSDAFASLSVPRRHLLALVLGPCILRKACVNVPTLELLTAILDKLRVFSGEHAHTLSASIGQVRTLNAKIAKVTRMGGEDPALGNLLMYLLVVEKEDFEPEALIELSRKWRELFVEPPAKGAA
jgi:MoxR-like ATPase